MKPLLWALLFAMIPPVGLGDDPRRITVRVVEQPDFVKLAPAGDPPTSSAARITRVVDPATGKAYDPSNKELGCDPNRLRRTFRLEAPRVLLGEPILVEFRTELDGPGIWEEQFGGNSRGSLGRDDSFLFLMRHEDGTWVPDIFEGRDRSIFGGPAGRTSVSRDEPTSDWLAVQQWCAIDRPGVYDLYAFHASGGTRRVGVAACVEAALTEEQKKRFFVDGDGDIRDQATGDPARDLAVVRELTDAEVSTPSPIAALIPDVAKAKRPHLDQVTSFAHFTLTIRPGDEAERRAMVERWTAKPVDLDDAQLTRIQSERAYRARREHHSAARLAMILARQDDFLPEFERQIRVGDISDLEDNSLFLGLAMRDDPRVVPLLFDAEVTGAIEVMELLRPPCVPQAIPRLIDLLTSLEHTTRADAEGMLRGWTGQNFGHTWDGYNHRRPTPEEGRAMQPLYRTWWERSKGTFRPQFRSPE